MKAFLFILLMWGGVFAIIFRFYKPGDTFVLKADLLAYLWIIGVSVIMMATWKYLP